MIGTSRGRGILTSFLRDTGPFRIYADYTSAKVRQSIAEFFLRQYDRSGRILALSPEADRAREPATIILNWPALLTNVSAR